MSTLGERLVREYFERVHCYVRMRVPERDCDDIVGDIFLRAIERQDQIRGDAAGWLFAVARTRVAEHYRNREHAMHTQPAALDQAPLPDAPAASTGPLEKLERAEFTALLRRKMNELTELERDVIALKFTDGLANVQIAKFLGITPSHLGVVLHRALRQLRDAMAKEA